MKILFLGEPESPNTMNWVNALRALGCEVCLASARASGTEKDVTAIGAAFLPPRMRIFFGVSNLKQIIADFSPDILIAYRITSYGFLAARTGFHPLVLAAQNEGIVYLPNPSRWREALLGFFAKFALRHADLIHSWSPNITEGLMKFGADPDKILTLHRGIDTRSFAQLVEKRKQTVPTSQLVFISTRSLYPEYRLDLLLNAFAIFANDYHTATLNIVGDGPEAARLKTMATNLGIEKNVKFYGHVHKEKLLELLSKSHIYISLIATEGMSSSLLEAVVAGLLPVVVDMPASRLIVKHKVNGFLLTSFDPDSIAGVLSEVSSQFHTMAHASLENSIEITSKFDVEQNQKVFLEKYQDFITS
jgi:glycosyltransferase involved in cell wall biosynthesis